MSGLDGDQLLPRKALSTFGLCGVTMPSAGTKEVSAEFFGQDPFTLPALEHQCGLGTISMLDETMLFPRQATGLIWQGSSWERATHDLQAALWGDE